MKRGEWNVVFNGAIREFRQPCLRIGRIGDAHRRIRVP